MINTIVFDIGMVLVYFRWKELYADLGYEGEKFDIRANATVHNPWWNEFDKGLMTVEVSYDDFIANCIVTGVLLIASLTFVIIHVKVSKKRPE